ncbi:hypothetical protein B0J13DRAFT_93106 [Dactylonectria estremocensis]|uniref:Uncharacterized protein n=1 Tax=Dactylonectria estremocensis TaxID=1079267 RepID=A0A9P9ITQ7_9HYPO|nr:hypothetical protein B0J13DRAFT_93106 [Dactylonectria estremocensis]
MSNVRYPTYLLSPNWTFRPGGKIAIGNVIVDPLLPHRAIIKADPQNPMPIDTATERNWQLSIKNQRNLDLSIWVTFIDKIGVKLGLTQTHIKDGQYEMTSLDTESLQDDLSDQYIETLCKDPKVKEYMRLDSLLCKPVYIVTGLKIAKGLSMSGTVDQSAGFAVKAGADLATGSTIATPIGAKLSSHVSAHFESEDDIVFAYQLMMIKPKGWTKNKKFVATDFRKNAFLSDETDELEETVEGASETFDPLELQESRQDVRIVNLRGLGSQIVRVAYREN